MIRTALRQSLLAWADLPLRWKGVVVVAIPLVALLVAAVSFFFNDKNDEQAEGRVRHTSEVRAAIGQASIALLDAETGVRVEDNLPNLELIQRLLARRPKVSVLPAMQGGLGLDLAREHRPDLILLDLHLPDISGEAVLRRLQAAPETRHIPVVVISADATPGQINRLLAAGARAYLTKPLDVRGLLTLLAEILDKREPGHAESHSRG